MIFIIQNSVNKERVSQASGNKETGLHKGAENRMATDFLTLEDRRHFKNAFKILKSYCFLPKTNIQTSIQTKYLANVKREERLFKNARARSQISLCLFF